MVKSIFHISMPSLSHKRLTITHLRGGPSEAFAIYFLFLKGTTALWSGKENVQSVTTTTMQPIGQSQSKVTAVSGDVDQSKPDVHLNSHIDP